MPIFLTIDKNTKDIVSAGIRRYDAVHYAIKQGKSEEEVDLVSVPIGAIKNKGLKYYRGWSHKPQVGDQILINDGDSFTHVHEVVRGPYPDYSYDVVDDKLMKRRIGYISPSSDAGYEDKFLWRVKQGKDSTEVD